MAKKKTACAAPEPKKFNCKKCGRILYSDPKETNAFGWCGSCQYNASQYGMPYYFPIYVYNPQPYYYPARPHYYGIYPYAITTTCSDTTAVSGATDINLNNTVTWRVAS